MTTSLEIARAMKSAEMDRYSHRYAEAVKKLKAVDLGVDANEHGFVTIAAREMLAGCEAAHELNNISKQIEDILEDHDALKAVECGGDENKVRGLAIEGLKLTSLASRVNHSAEAISRNLAGVI